MIVGFTPSSGALCGHRLRRIVPSGAVLAAESFYVLSACGRETPEDRGTRKKCRQKHHAHLFFKSSTRLALVHAWERLNGGKNRTMSDVWAGGGIPSPLLAALPSFPWCWNLLKLGCNIHTKHAQLPLEKSNKCIWDGDHSTGAPVALHSARTSFRVGVVNHRGWRLDTSF